MPKFVHMYTQTPERNRKRRPKKKKVTDDKAKSSADEMLEIPLNKRKTKAALKEDKHSHTVRRNPWFRRKSFWQGRK